MMKIPRHLPPPKLKCTTFLDATCSLSSNCVNVHEFFNLGYHPSIDDFHFIIVHSFRGSFDKSTLFGKYRGFNFQCLASLPSCFVGSEVIDVFLDEITLSSAMRPSASSSTTVSSLAMPSLASSSFYAITSSSAISLSSSVNMIILSLAMLSSSSLGASVVVIHIF
ncbi:hypothetical protein ACFE04_020633 [Oxalis oulophora]